MVSYKREAWKSGKKDEPQVKECRWSLKAGKAKEINLPQNLKKAYAPSNTLVVDF